MRAPSDSMTTRPFLSVRREQPRNSLERGECLRPRMAVAVVAPARDDGDRRLQLLQLRLEALILGAVMRDLEDLDALAQEPRSDVRFRVGAQEGVDGAVPGEEDDCAPVGVVAR